jgi:secreted trypsin-like serine protease
MESSHCAGDSGGPLFTEMTGFPVLVGITSKGELFCGPGSRGGYTAVAWYSQWVEQTIRHFNWNL